MDTEPEHQLATLQIPGLGRELKLYVHDSIETVSSRMLELGEWEPSETHCMQLILGEGDFVIDVGANIGYYTLLASQLVGSSGRVLALEPDELNFKLLAKNTQEFGNNNVKLLQVAAAAKSGPGFLYRSEDNFGDHRIFSNCSDAIGQNITTVTLDKLVLEWGTRPNLVKIDCQGAETNILQGMAGMFNNPDLVPSAMLVEYWPYALTQSGSSAQEMLSCIPVSEYEIWNISPWDMQPFKTDQRSLLMMADNEKTPEAKPYTVFTNLLLIHKSANKLLVAAADL